jgi:hypothetical protein
VAYVAAAWPLRISSKRAEQSNVELVPTPTYADYLNRIESHFCAIREFVVKNADYLDRDAFAHAMAQHIRYRNESERRAEGTRPTGSPPQPRRVSDDVPARTLRDEELAHDLERAHSEH